MRLTGKLAIYSSTHDRKYGPCRRLPCSSPPSTRVGALSPRVPPLPLQAAATALMPARHHKLARWPVVVLISIPMGRSPAGLCLAPKPPRRGAGGLTLDLLHRLSLAGWSRCSPSVFLGRVVKMLKELLLRTDLTSRIPCTVLLISFLCCEY
jgi:hypothetical protein